MPKVFFCGKLYKWFQLIFLAINDNGYLNSYRFDNV